MSQNTPAASSSSNAGPSSTSTGGHPDDDRFFSTLARASNTVKGFLQDDSRWNDLSDHLSAAQYQYKLQLVSPWAPIERQRVLSIPDAVIEASSSAETFASQGLFPEIERAWIVIDTRLYLWNYLDAGADAFESYEHPERVIQAVGLVRPKAGVFIDSIKHVLVVCTNNSITLLGLAIDAKTGATTNGSAPGAASTSSAAAGKAKELKLFVTEMNIPTEGVQMSDVCGTEAGRIFCKGNDGCLYEVLYQASEGWFSSRCSLRNVTTPRLSNLVPTFIQGKQKESLDYICVDSARSIVYTLHKDSEIELHHLPSGDSSKPPVKIARAKDICRHANMICPNTTLLQPNEFQITWMMPLEAAESKSVHLIAVTSKGVRLYFTNQRGGWRALSGYGSTSGLGGGDANTPTCLELIYVRPPPPAGQTQSAEGGMSVQHAQQQHRQQSQGNASQPSTFSNTDFAPHQPLINGVNHAYYSDGLFLAAGQYTLEPTGSLDCILCVNRAVPSVDAGRQSSMSMTSTSLQIGGSHTSQSGGSDLADTATNIVVQGATWAIAEVSRKSIVTRPKDRLHPLALQMLQPPRVFLVLTSSGLFVLIEERPIDTLQGLLQIGTIYDQTVHEFFKKYGQSQSCAMSLAIASQNSMLTIAPESHLSSTKTQGEVSRYLGQDVISHAWRIFFDFGGHPRYEPPPYPSQPASDGKVTLSGRHDGLAIYLTRLLRQFWTVQVTRKEMIPGEGQRQSANIAASILAGPQRELRSLQKFLDQNAQLFGLGSGAKGSNAPRSSGSVIRGSSGSTEGDQIALQAEKESFDAIRLLLSRSLEAVSFVLLLIDYKLPTIVQRCRPEIQNQLATLTFADLVITKIGRDVGRSLVEAIIDVQISSQVNVDVVADILQERCGGFCNADDVRLYKALEYIRRAKEASKIRDEAGKNEALKESLRLLNRATGNLPMDKLEGICKDYRELRFIHGAIELPLQCVSKWDSIKAAEAYRAQGMPSDDPRKSIYDLSMRCYSLVLETLDSLDNTASTTSQEVAKPSSSSEQSVQNARAMEEQRQNAYQQAQASSDALFHVAMYDWLLSRNKTDELLRIRSPFVEDYLRSEPITLERCLLLCLWYVSVGENFSAAQLYAGLAQSTELDITLEDRVEYLTKASGNAKSTFQHSQDLINFINDIDEKLEVASIQIEVFKSVQESLEIEEEQKTMLLGILNDNLLDVTQLYRDFAEPLQMHEVKLLIYHVSDHRDLDLVRVAWQALIAEAHEDSTAMPETRFEKVASVVVELGQRFYPSEVAFPIDLLTDMLVNYSFEQQNEQDIPSGWSTRTMLTSHAPPQLLLDVLLGLLETRREPCQTEEGFVYVLNDIAILLQIWVEEILGISAQSIGIKDVQLNFSARRVDDIVGSLLMHASNLPALPRTSAKVNLGAIHIEKVKTSLKTTQDLIRRSF